MAAQTDRDMEVIVVDDGSKDNTREVVEQWRSAVNFDVVYVYQENQGKATAHNTMLKHATGEVTVLLDSDDLLTEDALATIRQYWGKVRNVSDCAGVECLCTDLNTGELLGTPYPRDEMISNFLEIRRDHHIRGDKLHAIATSVLKQYPFPRFNGEKHIPPSTVWSRIAHQYRFLHINKSLKLVEYQGDGISKGWRDKKTSNPCGYRQYYLEILDDHKHYFTLAKRFVAARRYVYLSFLCGTSFVQQMRDTDNRLLYLGAFPLGVLKYLGSGIRRHRVKVNVLCAIV